MSSYTLDILVNGKDNATGALSGIGGVLSGLGKAALAATAVAGTALAGLGVKSVGLAGDFEAGMNGFAAVTGKSLGESGKSLGDFKNLFLQLGKELPVSTSEVQQAAIEMAKGGIDPATIAAGGLRQVLQFAAAGGTSLADAATIASKAVGGWVSPFAAAGEKADFLAHSTDLIAKAANASTVDVEDLALGMYNVQGTAKLAGVSFDETVTTLAQLAPAFSSSADAGTSLKVMLSRLQPATDSQYQAMDRLHLINAEGNSVFYDTQGHFIGMAAAAQKLHAATANLSEADREMALQTIFGQDAIRAAAVLAENGADGYNAMSGSIAGMMGSADMAAQKQQGFNTALDNFKGSIEALLISVGSQLLPTLTKLFNNVLAPGVNVVSDFADGFFAATDKIGFLGSALASAQTAVVAWVQDVLPGFTAQLGQWATAFSAWVAPAIPPLLAYLAGLAGQLFGWISAQSPAIWTQLQTWGQQFLGWISPLIPPFLAKLGDISGRLWTWIAEVTPPLLAKLGEWGTAFGKWVSDKALPYLQEKLPPLWDKISTWIGETTPKVVAKLYEWGTAFGTWITEKALPWLGEKLPPLWDKISTWIGETAPKVGAKLYEWGTQFGTWITDKAIPWLGEKLPPLWDKISTWIGETAPKVGAKLYEWGTAFGTWITEKALPWLGEKLPPLWDKISTWIGETAPKVGAKLYEWGTQFGTWITDKAIPYLSEKLPQIWEKITSWAGERAADAGGLLRNTGNCIVDGLWLGISEKWDRLKSDVGGLFTGLVDWVRGLLGIHSPSRLFADQIGAMLPAGMAVGITANASVAQNAVADVAGSLMPAAAGALSSPFSMPNVGVASSAMNAAGAASGQGSAPVVVNVNVNGSVISERDLGLIVRDQFEQMQRRNGALGFG